MKPENGNLPGSFPLKKMYSQKIHVEKLRKRVDCRGVREKETWINIAQRASRKNKRKRERREHEGKKKKKRRGIRHQDERMTGGRKNLNKTGQ